MLKPAEEDEADAKALVEQLVRSHARLPPPQRPSLAHLLRRVGAFEYTLSALERLQRGDHLLPVPMPMAPPADLLVDADVAHESAALAAGADTDADANACAPAPSAAIDEPPVEPYAAATDGSQAEDRAATPSHQAPNTSAELPSPDSCDIKPPPIEAEPPQDDTSEQTAKQPSDSEPLPLPMTAIQEVEVKQAEDEEMAAAPTEMDSANACSPSKPVDASATASASPQKECSIIEPPLAMPLPCLEAALQAFQDEAQAMCVLFSSFLSNFITAVGEKVRKRRHTTPTGGSASASSGGGGSGPGAAGANEDTSMSQGEVLGGLPSLLIPLSTSQPQPPASNAGAHEATASAAAAAGGGVGVPFALITAKELAELGIGVRKARTLLRPLFQYAKRYSLKAAEAFRTARAELCKNNFDPHSGALFFCLYYTRTCIVVRVLLIYCICTSAVICH